MKLRLTYPDQFVVEIEDSLENCVQFVTSCADGKTTPVVSKRSKARSKSSPKPTGSARPYGGKVNRRQLVLDTLKAMAIHGNDTPSLAQISASFAERYPTADMDNLAQVVRDLANKTDLVSRLERGTFRLNEDQ